MHCSVHLHYAGRKEEMIKNRSLEIIFLDEITQFVITEYKRSENIRKCQRNALKDIHSMQISLLSTIYFKGYFKR